MMHQSLFFPMKRRAMMILLVGILLVVCCLLLFVYGESERERTRMVIIILSFIRRLFGIYHDYTIISPYHDHFRGSATRRGGQQAATNGRVHENFRGSTTT